MSAGGWRLPAWLATAVLVLSGGCTTLGYYAQAVNGQLEIIARRRPIETLLQDPGLPVELRTRLSRVKVLRRFAADRLHLPSGNSYLSYVDLGRDHVLWTVTATPEFSLKPRKWCFPVAGCVTYRGYFSRPAAKAYGKKLAAEGWDVAVGGVTAYSTLGWFADPVLSSFIDYPLTELADLIFHELAHRRLYVPDDTAFNEGFATFVAHEGVRRWIHTLPDGESGGLFADYNQRRRRHRQFVELLGACLQRLEGDYGLEIPILDKRRAKAAAFARLQTDYGRLKASWDGDRRYDAWFERRLNNAHLASVASYNDLVPAFSSLLVLSNGDLQDFYRRCEGLAALKPADRRERLGRLLVAGRACDPRED